MEGFSWERQIKAWLRTQTSKQWHMVLVKVSRESLKSTKSSNSYFKWMGKQPCLIQIKEKRPCLNSVPSFWPNLWRSQMMFMECHQVQPQVTAKLVLFLEWGLTKWTSESTLLSLIKLKLTTQPICLVQIFLAEITLDLAPQRASTIRSMSIQTKVRTLMPSRLWARSSLFTPLRASLTLA